MAEYPTLAATLAALNSTKTDPADTEAANKLAAVDRQTRTWLYDFLTTLVDPSTGKLKSSAFAGDSIPFGTIRGTNPVDNSAREIAQGTIHNSDILDGTIKSAKIGAGEIKVSNLGTGSVTTDKLADGGITSDKLASGAFNAAALLDGSVTTPKLGYLAVTSDKLASNAVRTDKILNGQVTGAKLEPATEGYFMIGGNGGNKDEFASKKLGGVIQVNSDGIASFSGFLESGQLGFVEIAEVAASAVDGGNPVTVDTWLYRGVTPGNPWAIVDQTRALITIMEEKLYFLESGSYLIEASAPGHACQEHMIRLAVLPDGEAADVFTFYGTSEYTNVNAQTRSTVKKLIDVTVGPSQVDIPYITIEHIVGALSGVTTHTWGKSRGTGATQEKYATVSILKLS